MLILILELSIWHVSLCQPVMRDARLSRTTQGDQGLLVEQSKELPKCRETLFTACNS